VLGRHLSLNKDWIYGSEARIQKKEVELNLEPTPKVYSFKPNIER